MLTSLDAISGIRGPRIRATKLRGAVLTLLVALAAAGCSSSHALATTPAVLTARQLTTRILPAPNGYEIDPTPHASGAITRALFDQFGGVRSPSKFGFVAGFKQNYLNPGTGEGLIVTVIEFKSSRDASDYFAQTRPNTLSYAGATLEAFPPYSRGFRGGRNEALQPRLLPRHRRYSQQLLLPGRLRNPRTVVGAGRTRIVGGPAVHGP